MGFFDQNKALIITVLLISLLLLLMYNIRLSHSNNEMRETLLNLESLETEEPLEEEEQELEPESEEEQPPPTEPSVETHQAYNQDQEESQSNFQDRLDEIFEKNSAEQTASEEENEEINNTEGSVALNESNREEVQEQSDGNNSSENISTQQGTLRNSSISFSLVGRSAIDIPNPIYTCDTSGKIVVNITVDEEGTVTGTSINKASSTSNNECLVDNAIDYAAGALFSGLNGRNAQKGTITYYFQGQ